MENIRLLELDKMLMWMDVISDPISIGIGVLIGATKKYIQKNQFAKKKYEIPLHIDFDRTF